MWPKQTLSKEIRADVQRKEEFSSMKILAGRDRPSSSCVIVLPANIVVSRRASCGKCSSTVSLARISPRNDVTDASCSLKLKMQFDFHHIFILSMYSSNYSQ